MLFENVIGISFMNKGESTGTKVCRTIAASHTSDLNIFCKYHIHEFFSRVAKLSRTEFVIQLVQKIIVNNVMLLLLILFVYLQYSFVNYKVLTIFIHWKIVITSRQI